MHDPNELIAEVASRHGVILASHDPLAVTATIFEFMAVHVRAEMEESFAKALANALQELTAMAVKTSAAEAAKAVQAAVAKLNTTPGGTLVRAGPTQARVPAYTRTRLDRAHGFLIRLGVWGCIVGGLLLAGRYWGIRSSSEEMEAIMGWGDTNQGRRFLKFAKAGSLDAVLDCSGPGWIKENNTCLPMAKKGHVYGWNISK